jgi:hypothetical protein
MACARIRPFAASSRSCLLRLRKAPRCLDSGLSASDWTTASRNSPPYLFRSSRFLRKFSQSPQPLTVPDFRLQLPRLLFLVDDNPTANRGRPPRRSKARRHHAPPKAGAPPMPTSAKPASMPDPRSSPATPSGSQSQFPATPIGSTKNWVRSFILLYPVPR